MKNFIPLAILLLAAFARFGALGEDVRFHGDEALFATYARHAAVQGDWLLSGPLDKPPLSLYAMALSMQFTGVTALPDGVLTLEPQRGEWSARFPGALAGIVTVALIMSAAHQLSGQRAAWFAGSIAALSPQMAAFSATAFTDPLLVAFLTASLTAALSRRPTWSGLWLAAAFATKQQAIFYFPLILILSLTPRPRIRPFLLTFALGLAVLLLWDAIRPDPSIFTYAADNNNPYRLLVPPTEWLSRLAQWLTYASTAFGAWPVTAAVISCAVFAVAEIKKKKEIEPQRHRGHRETQSKFLEESENDVENQQKNVKKSLLSFSVSSVPLWLNFSLFPFLLLFLFSLLYLLAHIVLPFNLYDRYLLLAYPPIILLAAHTLSRLTPRALTLPVLALIFAAALTTPARFPSDVRDRDDGVIALGEFIDAQGIGTIVYNHWLGWEMGFYIGAWSDKRVVFYPSPDAFAADAPRNPDSAPRLLIAPSWANPRPWLDAAHDAGFTITTAYRSADYAAYWLLPS